MLSLRARLGGALQSTRRSWRIKFNKSTIAAVQDFTITASGMGDEHHQQLDIPFARSKTGPFFQAQPVLGNQYLEDVTLRAHLKRHIPQQILTEIEPDLERFGLRVATDIYELGRQCELNLPSLQHYDSWGKRVDIIHTCEAWKQLKRISAEEGVVAIAYERKQQEYSRLYQVVKNYLYAPSSGLFSCPLAMTDGAAKSLEGDKGRVPPCACSRLYQAAKYYLLAPSSGLFWCPLLMTDGAARSAQMLNDTVLMERAFSRLTSRDPDKFWTSGQWMTERKGGSDVANGTQTLAVPQSDGSYKLYGYKWFTSATDSDMSLTLARVVDDQGRTIDGTRGVSMFYLEMRDSQGVLNNIEVQRLKDKLGTRQVPTAELLLDGTRAYKVSDEGRGVASIAHMLTLTRIHNATSSAGSMRRIINLARDYTTKRECFGKVIKDHRMHIKTLANMEIEARSALLLVMELAYLLGLEECGLASEDQKDLFRLLTPLAKLYTAKQAVAVVSEGLECFGGMGYLEDTDLPKHLRDSQVLPIWEGTTNILSLDVLRALAKSQGRVLEVFCRQVKQRSEIAISHAQLGACSEKLSQAADQIVEFASQNTDKLELAARDFAYSLARTYMGLLLVEHASWAEATPQDILVAQRWCEQEFVPVVAQLKHGNYEDGASDMEFQLVFDGYVPTEQSKL